MSLLVGVLVYVLLMRKMTGEMVLAAILTTIAIGILLRGLVILIWSAAQQHPLQALRFSNPSIELLGGARISTCAALMVLMTALVYGSLFAFLRFGSWGIRMRAAGQNPLLAAQRGVNLHAIYALAWGLSTLTGSIAGMLIALDSGLDQTMVVIGLKAFAPALVAASTVSWVRSSAPSSWRGRGARIHYIDPLLSDVVPFLVLIAMLDRAPLGPVRHPRGADRAQATARRAAISAPAMPTISRSRRRGWSESASPYSC